MAITLKAARVNRGLTQAEAAQGLGITPITLSAWENGRGYPDVPAIKRIEKLYGIAYADIIFLLNEHE